MNRTILANLVNDIMVEAPPPGYARAMAAVTPRKLWQAEPGDCLVLLAPCGAAFRDYVARFVDLDEVEIVAPKTIRECHALDVVKECGAYDRVAARPTLLPFVLDTRVVEFAARAGLRIDPYTEPPGPDTLAAVYEINTKHGFRRIATSLGLPVAAGGHAATPASLRTRLKSFLAGHPVAIVKAGRSSNGYGNTIVRAEDLDRRLRDLAGPHPGAGWVYEAFLPFDAAPSMEMIVGYDGVEPFYSCDQRTVDNAWTGMITPADPAHTKLCLDAAYAIGGWLHGRGYRGVFDVDCGIVGEDYVVTEANVRRTGGTYLEELVRRLNRPPFWRADVRRGRTDLDFAGAVRAVDRAGLAESVILTADTVGVDGTWRYLITDADATAAAEIESALTRLLGLA